MLSSEHHSAVTPGAPATMLAVCHPAYGGPDVLRIDRVATPRPADHEVLVRVHAASVCKGDVHMLTGLPWLVRLGIGLRRPRRGLLGQDLAGRIEAVGRQVTGLRPGDAVFGQVTCGAFAEYVAVAADRLAPMPSSLDFEEAAAVPDSGLTALQGLRDVGRLRAGQSVLINGASGGVGTFAVQIAKALGAEVTAVCSTRHVELAQNLGADRVIDYTRQDFVADGLRHDVALDLAGNRSLADWRRVLKREGALVSCSGAPGGDVLGPLPWMARVVLAGTVGGRTMRPLLMRVGTPDLIVLKDMIESGRVRPVIERRHPLADTIEAMRQVMAGHARGKTVIRIA